MRYPGLVLSVAVLLLVTANPRPHLHAFVEQGAGADTLHRAFDQILDLNVRDGLVYYRAVRASRASLDRYAASLNVPATTYQAWTREQQMAFWLNAYNAFVLQTVVDHYPINGSSKAYPSNSVRQIPGGFEQLKHRAAGQSLTLDDIEKKILPQFKEPRLYLALGRGAVGSGRLRSEAYTGEQLKQQLDDVQEEFVSQQAMIRIDRSANQVSVTPIMSWHDAEFVAAYDPGANGPMASRSPIERAIVAFVSPRLLPLEKEFLQKNEFKVTYHPFDWRLNDLTGGPPSK
jgi:uncharacterized protein DUF547